LLEDVCYVAAPACDLSYTAAQITGTLPPQHDLEAVTPSAFETADSPIALVRTYLEHAGIVLGFDGAPRLRANLTQAVRPDDFDTRLARDDLDVPSLVDDIVFAARDLGHKLSVGDVQRALRKLQREATRQRRIEVMQPLLRPLDDRERELAEQSLHLLCEVAFDMDPKLSAAILKQLFYQAKRKTLDLAVKHAMMPIVHSDRQGSGKSTLSYLLASPMQDLVCDAALLSDIADKRSTEILSFPLVVIDDCEQIKDGQVSIIKSVLTNKQVSRRKLGTSLTQRTRQDATFIANGNQFPTELIQDATGHRRFVGLPFAIDPASPKRFEAWKIINETDYTLLWRSVDVLAPPPIEEHLDALREHQAQAEDLCEVGEWLSDLRPNDPKYGMIRLGSGLRAQGLYKVFQGKTGSKMSMTAWGQRMNHLTRRPAMPLGPKHEVSAGTVYPIR
jgi:hypothetical protein